MAVTENSYTGNGSTTNYSFTFPYLKSTDVQVQVDAAVTTAWSFANATTVQFNTAPANGAKIKILRDTNVDSLAATFYAGSAIKSEDLNDNYTQNLYKTQEVGDRYFSNTGGTMTGDLTLAQNVDLIFEGATDDANETRLQVADPTADRTITLPNVTGTVVTTGDTGTVAHAMLAGDAVDGDNIANDSINSEHYVDGSIDTAHIADSQVTTAKIADSNVTTAKIADANVTAAKIAADAITGAKIADDAINSEHYTDGSIDTAHIADGQVTHVKLANDAVDGDNIVDDSINSEHYVDGSIDTAHIADSQITHVKLANDAVDGDNIADDSINSEHYVDGSIDTAHIADSQITSAKIADGSVVNDDINASAAIAHTKLAAIPDGQVIVGNGSTVPTAVAISGDVTLANDGAVTIANNAVEIGMLGCEQTTISDSDSHIPTSGAVVDYVAAQLQPFGGFEVIADEDNFPTSIPASGVVISITDAAGVVFNGSGQSTTARTAGNGSDNVTINGAPSSLYGETLASGVGLQVVSTGSSNTYNFHRIIPTAADTKQLSDDINDFFARYRINAGEPSSNNDAGDLVFDTNASKMKVYDGSSWGEVTSTGEFKYLFLCPAGGTGAPTLDGSTATYDLREGSNSGTAASVTNAAQLIVSVNGIVQKANTGNSAPSEGFALVDANTIIFGANLASGDSVFIVQIGSAVSIPTPGDNTVTSAKIVDGAIVNADINASAAIAGSKLADDSIAEVKLDIHNAPSGTDKFLKYTSNGMEWAVPSYTTNTNILSGGTIAGDVVFDNGTNAGKDITWDESEDALEFADSVAIALGTGKDMNMYHDGSNTYFKQTGTGSVLIWPVAGEVKIISQADGSETVADFNVDGACELYHNNSKKIETTSAGVTVTGTVTDTKGELRNVPQVTASSNLVIVASHAGKHILHSGTGGWTINTSTGFAIGDMVTFINHTASAQTLFQAGGVTLYDTADGATGDHSVAARGMVTAINVASNVFYLSGNIE